MTPTSGEKTASLREDELHGECRSNRAIVSLIMSFASLAQKRATFDRRESQRTFPVLFGNR